MRAKITKFSLQRTQNFNLGDFHGVKIGIFNATVEMLDDRKAQVSMLDDLQDDNEPAGFEIDLAPGETFESLVVKVQGKMADAIRETAQGFKAYVVPFRKKSSNGMMVEATETFQGSPVE